MTESTAHQDGQRMLDLFASVGATHFDVTWTTCAGDKELRQRDRGVAAEHGGHCTNSLPYETHFVIGFWNNIPSETVDGSPGSQTFVYESCQEA